jgi:energy-coupling factor transporter ATP-binding protein EcfA2
MITIDSFSFTYPGMDAPALQDISLRIESGEAVLIRGASGSGKSTFLYCLNGIIPHVFAGTSLGSVRLNGFAPPEVPLREIARTVGTVFQNPESQVFMMRVEDDVAFGCENLLLPREEIISRRDEALRSMDLWDLRHRETFKLSGGQKQRLAISSVYAMGPQVFLFDEPTTDLDGAGRREFIKIIRNLKDKGKTLVLVEHQYEDYLPLMDRIITLENGRIVNSNTPMSSPMTARKTTAAPAGTVISLKEISFGYDRGKNILDNIDMTIRRGEVVALKGDNGSGKTTLLKILGGLLRPLQGEIAILGLPGPTLESLVSHVGFLFQNPDEQLFAQTVSEEVAFGPSHIGKKPEVERYLNIAGLKAHSHRHPQTLSRGQRQILAVVSVMAMEPEILILDEPTTGLDSKSWHELFSLLYDYANRRGTVIFSTHNEHAASAAGRRITLDNGRIISDEVSG